MPSSMKVSRAADALETPSVQVCFVYGTVGIQAAALDVRV
jgi:hypothetical protein